MKRILLPCILAILFIPAADAALDQWSTPIANAAGLTTAGTINVYLQHPDGSFGRVGDPFHTSALMTAPAATAPVVTWTVNHAHGCTTSNPTTRTTTTGIGVISSFDFDVTTTGTTCAVSIRLQYTVGAVTPTQIYDQQLTMALPSTDHSCSTGVLALDSYACGASDFQVATQLTGMEAFTFLAIAFAALVIGVTSPQPIARFAAAIIVLLLGVLLLSFTASMLVVVTAGALMLFAAIIFLQSALEWTRSRKPKKRLFE